MKLGFQSGWKTWSNGKQEHTAGNVCASEGQEITGRLRILYFGDRQFTLFNKYYQPGQTKDGDMARACSAHVGDVKNKDSVGKP
jgi:hypothetical protein